MASCVRNTGLREAQLEVKPIEYYEVFAIGGEGPSAGSASGPSLPTLAGNQPSPASALQESSTVSAGEQVPAERNLRSALCVQAPWPRLAPLQLTSLLENPNALAPFERCRLGALVRAGRFGSVYRSHLWVESVALKVFGLDGLVGSSRLEAARKEVEAFSVLSPHPNVTKLLDVEADPFVLVLACPLFNRTLATREAVAPETLMFIV